MTPPSRRRSDRPETVHARARAAAAARLDGRIDPRVNAWLDAHLAECTECAAIAGAYAGQQAELRALRDRLPQPPRDLWARTSGAIEREAARSARRDSAFNRNGAIRSRRRIAAPLGALSGLLVVAVVLGATVLSNRPLPTVVPTASAPAVAASSPSIIVIPGATPFAVAAGNVGWVRLGAAGHADVFDSTVNRVCPGHQGAECPPIDEPASKSITLPDQPSSVIKSPNDRQLVVVDSSTKGAGGQVYVVPDPDASPSPTPSLTPTPSPSATTTPPASPPATASARPTPATTPTVKPTPVDSPTPTRTPTPSITASATLPPVSPTPSAVVSASPSPPASPGTRAIARDVIIVGEAAAYSPDGTWFAFSARPADRSHGPDIYVWHVGADKATPITTDHRSVFATWLGKQVLGSRGVADPAQPTGSRTLRPEAFLLDPASGTELGLAGGHVWRPSVDPQRRLAVYWDGTLALNVAGTDLAPDTGNLVLGPWNDAAVSVRPGKPAPSPTTSAAPVATAPVGSIPGSTGAATRSPAAKVTPSPKASPAATSAPLPTGTATATNAPLATTTLATGRVTDWDARWDETGTHLAVWIADPNDPKSGKLTLYVVDPATGTLRSDRPVHDIRAQAGFSIGKGRLAWATPPGQDGRGSRIQVLAWTSDSVGSVETQQSEGDVVVIR